MEQILPQELLFIIFDFISIKELCLYDTALCNKNNRKIFLNTLKNYTIKYIIVSKWTFIRGIKSKRECSNEYKNMEYISNLCEELIISNSTYIHTHKDNNIIDINNNNITSLIIDLNIFHNSYLNSINAKKLKCLSIVYARFLNKDLYKLCPSLEKVIFIKPFIENLEEKLTHNDKIKIIIKY